MHIKKMIKKTVVLVCAIMLILPQTVRAQETSDLQTKIAQTAQSFKALSNKNNMLSDKACVLAGTSGSDWIAMTLAFSGETDDFSTYLKELQAYVAQQYKEEGCLDTFKATEYHRIAMTMLALGGDPAAVNANGTTVNLIADGTYNFTGETLGQQGSNGISYALLALDSLNYEIPADAKFTREMMIEQLLAFQTEDGGFAMTGNENSDLDITSMAVQALAPYTEQENVSVAVDAALSWLSENLTENGTFLAYDNESAESVAQAILALCAMGIDPEADERFINNGKSLMDGLESFRCENGMYMHTKADGIEDGMATYQSLLALEAVQKLRTNGTWILNFTDYQVPESEKGSQITVSVVIGAVVVCAVAAVILALKSRKSKNQ